MAEKNTDPITTHKAVTLRQKVVWIISAITVSLFMSLYTVGSTVLERGFINVENQSVDTDVKRVLTALDDTIEGLDKTAIDWSAWDATYDFIKDRNPQYIKDNFAPETLTNLDFNLVLLFDRSGTLVYGQGVNLDSRQNIPITAGLVELLRSHAKLLQLNVKSYYKGILELPEGPALIVSRPILTNEMQGPARGVMIVGRYIDASLIRKLSRRTKVPKIFVYPHIYSKLPSDIQAAFNTVTLENPIAAKPLNHDLISGFGLVPDIFGRPGLVIRVDLPRSVYKQGQISLQTFLVILIIAGMLFTFVTLILLEKLIFSRLFQLTAGIRAIQLTQDLSQRLIVKGEDELSRLGIALNKMLAALEHSQVELRQSQAQYEWQANHDALTKLPNRRKFEQHLQDVLHKARAQGFIQEHVVCILDLDQFKIINDTCGHAAGDELLRQISLLLQKQVRKTDLVARLGGDEFGFLLYCCDLNKAQVVAQSIQQCLQSFRFVWQEQVFTVGASIGLTQITQEGLEIANIMTAADLACYAAKNKGGNRVHFYDIGSRDLQLQLSEMHWAVKIRQSLEENNFTLYSQPIVSTLHFLNQSETAPDFDPITLEFYQHPAIGLGTPRHQKVVTHFTPHCEILLRLRDHDGLIISPSVFIPIAERYNLMSAIDRWVVQTLFSKLQVQPSLQLSSITGIETCQYAINLSGGSIGDPEFTEFLLGQFQQYRIPPQIICFEITETVAISNLKQAVEFMETLKGIGCKFSLDDFGSGMSSFAYLQSLPVDYLKIDGTFIKNLLEKPINHEIVRAINSVAHLMNIQTIAEFVEELPILETLGQLGVDYVQGYAIAKPTPL